MNIVECTVLGCCHHCFASFSAAPGLTSGLQASLYLQQLISTKVNSAKHHRINNQWEKWACTSELGALESDGFHVWVLSGSTYRQRPDAQVWVSRLEPWWDDTSQLRLLGIYTSWQEAADYVCVQASLFLSVWTLMGSVPLAPGNFQSAP